MLSEIPPKKLCDKISKSEKIAQGMSAAIYKTKNNKILKEIYIDEDINLYRKINEIYINDLIQKNPSISKYSVPFYGYDGICIIPQSQDKLLNQSIKSFNKSIKTFDKSIKSFVLEFANAGQVLYDNLANLNLQELKEAVFEIMSIVKIFNENGITHNDLHTKNIFYDSKTKIILLGDWGLGQNIGFIHHKLKHYENLDLFFSSLYIDTIFAHYFKNHKNMSKIFKTLKSLGLYKKYMKTVREEIDYVRKNFSYKPAEFLKSGENDTYIRVLQRLFSMNRSLKKQIIEDSNTPKEIILYLESLL